MINFFKRIFESEKPIATFTIEVYDDKLISEVKGDEVKLGGAMVSLMQKSDRIKRLLTFATFIANSMEMEENVQSFSNDFTTRFNPN